METELAPLCRAEPGRSEVYRDKNTMVEVTIHRRPKGGASTGRASAPAAGRVEGRGEGRTVAALLQELRGLVGRDSGPAGELRRFLEELEGPSWREPLKRGGCQVASPVLWPPLSPGLPVTSHLAPGLHYHLASPSRHSSPFHLPHLVPGRCRSTVSWRSGSASSRATWTGRGPRSPGGCGSPHTLLT
jgi:hypothetical protein